MKDKNRKGNDSIPRSNQMTRGLSVLNKEKNVYLREASERTQKTTFNQLKNIQKFENKYKMSKTGRMSENFQQNNGQPTIGEKKSFQQKVF